MVIQEKRILSSEAEGEFLLPEKELTRAYKKYSDPYYSGGSLVLDENATALDKAKYEVCQIILAYKQKKKLSIEEVAQLISLSRLKTEDILHCRINKFSLDKLVEYAERLLPALKMKAVAPEFSFSRRVGLHK